MYVVSFNYRVNCEGFDFRSHHMCNIYMMRLVMCDIQKMNIYHDINDGDMI